MHTPNHRLSPTTGMYSGFLITLVISFLVFYCTFQFQVWQPLQKYTLSDLPAHTQFVLNFSQHSTFPAYTLWYRLVHILSGFSLNYNSLAFTSIFLLSALVSVKYLLNYWILNESAGNKILVAIISLILIFVMPILTYFTQASHPSLYVANRFHVYLGNIAPNQWHNATLILAMPLNLIWFHYSVKHLDAKKLHYFLTMGVFGALSILCKPSYALAFLPIICSAILVINIKSKQYLTAVLKSILIAIPALLILTYQWYFTFINNELFEHAQKTVIAPFKVWGYYSPNLFISLLISIMFPLLVLAFYYKKIDRYLIIAWLTFFVALTIFSLVAEYPLFKSGNYWWSSIAANYILFLFSARLLLQQPFDWKAKITYGVLMLHFLSGCFHLLAFFVFHKTLLL